MCCPRTYPVLVLSWSCLLLISFVAASCSGGTQAASGAAADAAVGIVQSSDGVTVENRTGTTLVDGRVTLVPAGTQRFFMMLQRMQNSEKRNFPLDSFRTADGTPFRRGVARARTVNVKATDLNGKLYEFEVPFK